MYLPSEPIKNHSREMKLIKQVYFYMTLAVNIIDERGLGIKGYCESLPKKTKVILYLPFIHFTLKAFNQLYTNKMECFSFKSGCAKW